MNTKKQRQMLNAIPARLKKGQIKQALKLLKTLIVDNRTGKYIPHLDILEKNYDTLLNYFIRGIDDPERSRHIQKLKKEILILALKAGNRAYSAGRHPGLAGKTKEKVLYFRNLLEKKEAWTDEDLPDFTESFLYLEEMDSETEKVFDLFLEATGIPLHYKVAWTGIFILNAMKMFQWKKMEYLIRLLEHEEPEISQRALTGIFLIMLIHDEIMWFFKEELSRHLSPVFTENDVSNLIFQFIRTQDTERIEKHIKKDILPEMLEQTDLIREKLNEMQEEDFEENPDWEEVFKESPDIMDKLMEMSEMQLEGKDTFLSAFRHLKHFPFFNKISNWLMPFTPEHPGIKIDNEQHYETVKKISGKLQESFHMCNSDKYSLIFNILLMPPEQQNMMFSMFSSELDQINEIGKDNRLLDAEASKKRIITQFMQDLYRVLELSGHPVDIDNIFKKDIKLFQTVFGELFLTGDTLTKSVIEVYFKNKDYENVIAAFQSVNLPPEQVLFEKLAFSYQQTGRFKEAIENYKKAELYESESNWNRKKIAYCQMRSGNIDEAIATYKDLVESEPENISLLSSLGYCHIDKNDYEEALICFLKIFRIDPENKKALRPASWCYLNLKDTERAKEFLQPIPEDELTKHDYINLGHMELIKGNREAALQYYQKSIERAGNNAGSFFTGFNNDIPLLKSYGLSNEEILLIQESLR